MCTQQCTHPDHQEGQSCEDHAVSCHKDCECCNTTLSILWRSQAESNQIIDCISYTNFTCGTKPQKKE